MNRRGLLLVAAIVVVAIAAVVVYLRRPSLPGPDTPAYEQVSRAFYHGLAEGPERALVSDLVGAPSRGTAFGLYHAVVGGAALPAGLWLGWLWDRHGAGVAFRVDAGLAIGAAAVLAALVVVGPLRGTGGAFPAPSLKNG